MKTITTISAIGCAAICVGLWRVWTGVATWAASSGDPVSAELCPELIRSFCQGPFVLLLALVMPLFRFHSGRWLTILLSVGVLAGATGLWLSAVFAQVVGSALADDGNALLLLVALIVAPFWFHARRRLPILLSVGGLAGVSGLWRLSVIGPMDGNALASEGGASFFTQLQTCWWVGIGAAVVLLILSFRQAAHVPTQPTKAHRVRWALGFVIVYQAVAGVGCWRERHDVRTIQERFSRWGRETRAKLGEIHEGDSLEKVQRLFPEGVAKLVDGTGEIRIFLYTGYQENSTCTNISRETECIRLVSGKVVPSAQGAGGGSHMDRFAPPSPWYYFSRAWYSSDRWAEPVTRSRAD